MSNKLPLCQRCRLPLVAHESLLEIRDAQFGLLTGGLDGYESEGDGGVNDTSNNKSNDDVHFSKLHPYSNKLRKSFGGSSPNESFVVLTDSLMAGNSLIFPLDNGRDGRGNGGGGNGKGLNVGNGSNGGNGGSGGNGNANGNTNGNNNLSKSSKPSRSKRISTLENLFLELSGKSDIDYPICTDCAELIQEHLKPKYEESCRERDTYISFLNKIKDLPGPGSEEVEEMLQEIDLLQKENDDGLLELKEIEQKRIDAEQELLELQKESAQLSLQEEEFYNQQNKLNRELIDFRNEKDRVDSLYNYYTSRLKKLQRVNVYNDIFCIGHDGYFPTINGLRLGKLKDHKDHKVEWSEISAAWGQTLLLIATVIQKINFKLEGYRLRPLGSMSRIEKITISSNGEVSKTQVFELYCFSDLSFRGSPYVKIDEAMVEFLNILNQVGKFVESCDSSSDSPIKMPNIIEKDKIGGYTIKYANRKKDEEWTDACKHVLQNSKRILAYASKV